MEARIQLPHIQDRLRTEILQRWVQQDSPATLNHAVSLEHPAKRMNALRLILPIWHNADPKAAQQWIRDFPDPILRTNMQEILHP